VNPPSLAQPKGIGRQIPVGPNRWDQGKQANADAFIQAERLKRTRPASGGKITELLACYKVERAERGKRFVAALVREKSEAESAATAADVRRLEAELKADHDTLAPLVNELEGEIDSAERYLAARDRERLIARVHVMRDRIYATHGRTQSPHATGLQITQEVIKLLDFFTQLPAELPKRNEEFVNKESQRWRGFFNYCEEQPLTDEQARAVITFEENTLLVAAAGSGKTSTVVGKVLYALAKGIAKPNEILCLAFNKKASEEIGKRIKERLKAITAPESLIDVAIKKQLETLGKIEIESRTFHSLGLKIVMATERNYNRVLSKNAENADRISRAIDLCQEQSQQFRRNWLLLQTVARFPQPDETQFHSEMEYRDYLRDVWCQKKQQLDGIRTLGCRKLVKSFDEVAISNWLYLKGVEFKYEERYLRGAQLLCPGGTWLPDFTYTAGERVVIHEHFGLNRDGKAPAWFSNPEKYAKEAQRKQEVLRQITPLHFWTTSADYNDGTLFDKLEKHLVAAGIPMTPRQPEEVLEKFREIGQVFNNKLIEDAVRQIRENGWTLETLNSRLSEQPERERARLFRDVIWAVAGAVNDLLIRERRIDFSDQIRLALNYLRAKPGLMPFRFILADEFQDMAPGRGEMIQIMLRAREQSFFFAVGDDWQAINRFAGSDLRFFDRFGIKFRRRAGDDARWDLTETFRGNQGIADVARSFVLRNENQMIKAVYAKDKMRQGVIEVQTYQNNEKVLPKIEEILKRWRTQHPAGKKPSVFLLCRYGVKHAQAQGLSEDELRDLSARWADRIELHEDEGDEDNEEEGTAKRDENKPQTLFMTMHKSKGLEADYVLILGMFSGLPNNWFCFPSERVEDPLTQLVLSPKEALPDAEERRLFYVALTRAKHQVVLLTHARHPSKYVTELLRDHRCDGAVVKIP
jgi:DNA helicase IV